VTVKRAALLLSIAYFLLTAESLYWQLRTMLQIRWTPLGMANLSSLWTMTLSSTVLLSWAAYLAFLYRERSQRKNPVSLWAITLWTTAITAVAAVSSAIQFLMGMAATREARALAHITLPSSTYWWQAVGYAITALWITLLVLLAHDPKGQRTRRVAAVLACLVLLTGLLGVYAVVRNVAHSWDRTVAQLWYVYPLTAIWQLALGPSIRIFLDVCTVLFPLAVWKEIGPQVPPTEVAPEQPAFE
jgi:hypothetical protein